MLKPTESTASLVASSLAVSAAYSNPRNAEETPLWLRRSPGRLRWEFALKNCLDRSLAIVLLVLTAPIILAAMLIVKLSSRGPALYSQKRVGQFGRVFTIYKIRTMRHNCEKMTGPRWSTPGDPRVTAIGKILRDLHVDELPQLMNVIRGQMSLIGPRPERPEIAAKLGGLVEEYESRHSVLPGISGNAQIHLPPDTSVNDVRDKLIYDRQYIGRFTAWYDLKMMALTGLKMVKVYRPKG